MENELILTTEPCCNPITTCGTPTPIPPTIESEHVEFSKLAAVLQESILHSLKLHLKAKKHSTHVILEEYYEEAFDIIDGLIEHYQGVYKCVIVDDANLVCLKNEDPLVYFTDLKNYVSNFANNSNNFNERTFEIKSDIDDLLRLIDSTLYKLGNLTESIIKSFDAFVYENYK